MTGPTGSTDPPGPLPGRPALGHLVSVPLRTVLPPALDVAGRDLWGRPVVARLAARGQWSLLLFLGSSCDGCLPFWHAADDPASLGLAPDDAVRIVTHDAGAEDAAVVRALRERLGAAALVVMSSAAWRAYGVHGPPFFAVVDGETVRSEGVAWSVEQVAADVRRARRPTDAPTHDQRE